MRYFALLWQPHNLLVMTKGLIIQFVFAATSTVSTCSFRAYFLWSTSFTVTLTCVRSHLELVLSLWFQATDHHLQNIACTRMQHCIVYTYRALSNDTPLYHSAKHGRCDMTGYITMTHKKTNNQLSSLHKTKQ